jgi:ubiquinone/menaquinone biosynthesis C-methylase UbiE
MYRCQKCKTAFCTPQPTDSELKSFYSQFHRSEDENGWYDEAELRMQQDFPAKLALVNRTTSGNPGKLLDVGCGKGFFVKACVTAGWDAEGIDVSDTAVRYGQDKLGVKVHLGPIEALKHEVERFDTVTLWATIEHLPKPDETLRDIAEVLKPGGYLFLDTGRGYDWLDRLLPGTVQWYDPPQHLYVFSDSGLKRLLQAAGFEIVHFDGCFERNVVRKLIRMTRAVVVASSLRAISTLTGLRAGRFEFTRWPLGNLMSVAARRCVCSSTACGPDYGEAS